MTSQRVGRLIPAVMALSAAAFAWMAPAASADVPDVTIPPILPGLLPGLGIDSEDAR